MKTTIKILTIIAISFFFLLGSNSYAEEIEGKDDGAPITIIVTEKIPGADCSIHTETDKETGAEVATDKYECDVPKGFGSIIKIMGNIIKYFTFIAGLGGVLFIVVNGIMYSMSGIDQGMKDEAKGRIQATLLGLVLLLLSGVILNMIAPWVYK